MIYSCAEKNIIFSFNVQLVQRIGHGSPILSAHYVSYIGSSKGNIQHTCILGYDTHYKTKIAYGMIMCNCRLLHGQTPFMTTPACSENSCKRRPLDYTKLTNSRMFYTDLSRENAF